MNLPDNPRPISRRFIDLLSQRGPVSILVLVVAWLVLVGFLCGRIYSPPRAAWGFLARTLETEWGAPEVAGVPVLLTLLGTWLLLASRVAAGPSPARRRLGWLGLGTGVVLATLILAVSSRGAALARLKDPPVRVDPAREAWFSAQDGSPRLWFFEHPNGDLEFYDRGGFHAGSGRPLKPVTADLHTRWRPEAVAGPTTAVPSVSVPGGRWLRSRPAGAEVWMDWVLIGKTPLDLGTRTGAFVMLHEDGSVAVGQIGSSGRRPSKSPIMIELDPPRPPQTIAVFTVTPQDRDLWTAALASRASAAGLALADAAMNQVITESKPPAQGPARLAFEEWLCRRHGVASLLRLTTGIQEREIDVTGHRDNRIQGQAAGMVRLEGRLDLEIIRLRPSDPTRRVERLEATSTTVTRDLPSGRIRVIDGVYDSIWPRLEQALTSN